MFAVVEADKLGLLRVAEYGINGYTALLENA